MTWLQLIFVCVMAEVVAVTVVIGAVAMAGMIAHAIGEIADAEKEMTGEAVSSEQSANWFRQGGQE